MATKIGNRMIGTGHPCFVIAELGINHNGDVHLLERMIRSAKEAGADAVKLQKRDVDVVYSPAELAAPRASPFGSTNGDLKRGLELDDFAYRLVAHLCAELELVWFASPWDPGSVDFLEEFDPPCYKVASACVTDVGLLKRIAQTRKPVILSTGMSTLREIMGAVGILGTKNLILMQCTSVYPARPELIHLRAMRNLLELGPLVGYSGHEDPSLGHAITVAAVAMGACAVERHLTDNRGLFGSDQKASLEPHEFADMVRQIRMVETAMGSSQKERLPEEEPILKKLRRFP